LGAAKTDGQIEEQREESLEMKRIKSEMFKIVFTALISLSFSLRLSSPLEIKMLSASLIGFECNKGRCKFRTETLEKFRGGKNKLGLHNMMF
jgi:hypothetical protein